MEDKSNMKTSEKNKATFTMLVFSILFVLLSLVLVGRIVYVKFIWKPDPVTYKYFTPRKKKDSTEPERGCIIDHNGKLIALSIPLYDIYMDCTVQKESYAADKEDGAEKERNWRREAGELADQLPKVLKEEGKDGLYYRSLIYNGRKANRKYVSIAKGIDHETLLKLKKLPLWREGQFKGGMIVKCESTRQYPYKGLARSVVGYVRNNKESHSGGRRGIESKYDYALHGQNGWIWMRSTDNKGMIPDPDSTEVKVIDGSDVRTTIDINIQDIADRALRRNIQDEEDIDGGCIVLMEVETGAIRAMVNLTRGSNGELGEYYNLAIARAGEPGSIMKSATLMTLLEDGKVRLSDKIKTNGGKMENVNADETIRKYEVRNNTDKISILDGFKLSSNYVFRYLVKEHYGKCPEEYISRLYEYRLGDAFNFELEGFAKATLPDPKAKHWSPTDLIQSAIGYSVMETPLHMVTFYNAIANKGKMMKPYLVESIEKDGKVETAFKPEILNGSICSKATADTLLRALMSVTSEGTGTRLKNARCSVAGKTGTSWIVMDPKYTDGKGGIYVDKDGKKQYQATFVGFYPAEDPKYTAIVTIYSKPTKQSFHGGVLPAKTFREIVDNTYTFDDEWGEKLEESGNIPVMTAMKNEYKVSENNYVPDLKGMGLMDAIYAIENCGYICQYSGGGKVWSQSPAEGTAMKKGGTVTIRLK